MLAINGMPDHIHIFLGLNPNESISELVREIKKASNGFINDKRYTNYPFKWQSGYGAFTYKRSDLDTVIQYVMNQKTHHRNKSFKEEYLELLKEFEIEFKEEYLFEWYED